MSNEKYLLLVGALTGLFGAFAGGFAKFFWEHWLAGRLTWQREQQAERAKLLSQFRAPAMRAISDLQGRMFRVLRGSQNYEYLKTIKNKNYYITSTAFLLAQFFGWVEILRQKVSALDYSELVTKLEAVTQGFAFGGPGFQIFTLEQREIGERMITSAQNPNQLCMGYADFVTMLEGDEVPACFSQLIRKVRHLLDHLFGEMIRLAVIQHALIELIDFIDPEEHWVPKNRREKFDVMIRLKKMLDDGELSAHKYEEWELKAREAGVITQAAV